MQALQESWLVATLVLITTCHEQLGHEETGSARSLMQCFSSAWAAPLALHMLTL